MAAFKAGVNNTTAHAYTATASPTPTQFANTVQNHNCLVTNSGSASAYYATGTDTSFTTSVPGVFASQGGCELLANSTQVLTLYGTYIAVIGASTGTVTITRGDGI